MYPHLVFDEKKKIRKRKGFRYLRTLSFVMFKPSTRVVASCWQETTNMGKQRHHVFGFFVIQKSLSVSCSNLSLRACTENITILGICWYKNFYFCYACFY